MLDEPTVGLDPLLRRDLWQLFHDLAANGTTLLVSSHVMDEADRCDRLLLMREGAIVADGTPAELRERTGADDLEEAFVRVGRRRCRHEPPRDAGHGPPGARAAQGRPPHGRAAHGRRRAC